MKLFPIDLPFDDGEIFRAYKEFQVGPSDCATVSLVSFLVYCDRHSDEWQFGEETHHLIAQKLFKSFPQAEKEIVVGYITTFLC